MFYEWSEGHMQKFGSFEPKKRKKEKTWPKIWHNTVMLSALQLKMTPTSEELSISDKTSTEIFLLSVTSKLGSLIEDKSDSSSSPVSGSLWFPSLAFPLSMSTVWSTIFSSVPLSFAAASSEVDPPFSCSVLVFRSFSTIGVAFVSSSAFSNCLAALFSMLTVVLLPLS